MAHPACGKKLTERLNFGKAIDGIPKDLEQFVHDTTRKREGVVESLKNIDGSSETVVNTLKEYLAMNTTIKSILQKVRSYSRLRFKWSNMMDDDEKTTTNDIDEDMVSMMFAAGLWHMEHAHWLNKSITSEGEDENKMKQSLNSLKTAAGIIETAKAWEGLIKGGKDINASVLNALCQQSIAEAQSVTIRRAISKNHKASLISELCHDVSQKYTKAAGEVDASHHEGHKWSVNLKFQGEAYMALARCYQGVHLLEAEEKCGEAIVVLNEGFLHINQAAHLAKEYDKIKPKTKLHLEESQPFEKIRKLLNEKKVKSERENSMIYHARLPEECPLPLDPKCVIHVTALELSFGEDLTRTVTENTDAAKSEDKGGPSEGDAGLLSFWPLDGTDSQVSLKGSARYEEQDGRTALYLNESSGTFAETPSLPIHRTNLTIAVWIKMKTLEGNEYTVYGDWSSPWSFRLFIDKRSHFCGEANAQKNGIKLFDRTCTGNALLVNQWSHVAMTWGRIKATQGTLRLFINGEMKKSVNVTGDSMDFRNSGHSVYDIGLKRDSRTTTHAYYSDLMVLSRELRFSSIENMNEIKENLVLYHPLYTYTAELP